MAKKKMGGLGKGLDSLFADLSDDTGSEASNSTLPLREIEPDPEQPRKRFDDDALNQLADSITENGLLQPIAVRPKKVGPGYIIIAGERRWRAARLAGLDEVPVIIKDVTDEQAAADRQVRLNAGIRREKAGQEPQRRDQQPAPAGPARGCAPYGQRRQAELWPRQGPAGAAQ